MSDTISERLKICFLYRMFMIVQIFVHLSFYFNFLTLFSWTASFFPPGGDLHMKASGMFVRNFELNP